MPQRDHPGPGQAGERGDDFRKIVGIGPALAQRLWDGGILTYEDLARRTPEEIAAVLADVTGISSERIARQNWTGQARQLAGTPPEPPDPRQHYAAFHLEFLLESDNRVRRTKVHHHQSDARDAWPGWDEERLLAYLRDRIPLPAAAQPAVSSSTEPSHVDSPDQPPASVPFTAASEPPPPTRGDLPSSFLDIEELTPIHEGQRSYTWRLDEPNHVRLTMRVNPIGTPIHDSFDYSAKIAARMLGHHDRLPLGSRRGAISVNDPLSVEIAGPPLPTGLYRLVVAVDIYPAGHSRGEPPLFSQGFSGNLMQVADAPGNPDSAVA